jgi:hypothetical protein
MVSTVEHIPAPKDSPSKKSKAPGPKPAPKVLAKSKAPYSKMSEAKGEEMLSQFGAVGGKIPRGPKFPRDTSEWAKEVLEGAENRDEEDV